MTGPFPTPTFQTINVISGSTISGALAVGYASATGDAPQWGQILGGNSAAWNVVTGSRAIGTSYTNSAARPITVSVIVAASAAAITNATVGGVIVSQLYVSLGTQGTLFFIVPTGATYKVVTASGTNSLAQWAEL